MTQIHAPYHFVPLSSWVYMPEWAHLVSHDHPFEEGISGILDYELTNATPLLVGATSESKENQPSVVSWAKDPNGNPIIPGSSLKGMLRSFLEIATFSKFDRVDDHHFAYRDISASDTRYNKQILDSKAQAAWLSYDDKTSQWLIRECQHTALFSDDFNAYSRKLNSKDHKDIINDASQKTVSKFESWPLTKAPIQFNLGQRTMKGVKGGDVAVACATELGKGEQQGHPVFIGCRPGKKEYSNTRLNFNYCFYDTKPATQAKAIATSLVAKMFAAHDEKLVEHLKKQGHPTLGMPIFIRVKNGKNLAMGFAKMPKVLYDLSVNQVAEQHQKALNSQSVFDFTDLLFGALAESGFSLKSRVIFADAHLQGTAQLNKSSPVILGQPKASYLNAYLEQPSKDGFVHSDLSQYEKSSQLSGWKRYPIQQKFNAHLPQDLANKTNVQSQLELMKEDAVFKGKMVFHNLQPVELGALLWSLNPDKGNGKQASFYHSLGHGKSLGAGAVQFKVTLSHQQTNGDKKVDSASLKQAFISHMNSVYPAANSSEEAWLNSTQICHLLAFGNKEDNAGKKLAYMPLNTAKGSNTVSYSSSAKGERKPVLAAWCEQGEDLSRQEELRPSPTQLGKGRLSGLLKQLEEKELLSNFEKEQFEKIKAAEKQAQLNLASPQYRTYLLLAEELAPFKGIDNQDSINKREGAGSRIEQLINDCLADNNEASKEELQTVYNFACNFLESGYINLAIKIKDLSKKGKERHKERKNNLDKLQQLIAAT